MTDPSILHPLIMALTTIKNSHGIQADPGAIAMNVINYVINAVG